MKIIIVGGGAAGWITSFWLSSIGDGNQYVNISSNEIPIIGVGEGTTGRFTHTFSKVIYKTNITQMMYECNALPKLGIKFRNWNKSGKDFWSPLDGTFTQNYYIDYATYINPGSQYSFLMDSGRSNYFTESDRLNCNVEGHGFHLDAFRTAEYFRKRSIMNGVEYIDSTVKKVNTQDNKITTLVLDDGTEVSADLFIDCSGFARVLSSALEDTGWEDYSKYLPVNQALVFSFEEDDETSVRKEYTLSEAMDHGWVWEIPTRYKVGRGYVYCDKFATEDEIVAELEAKYERKIEKVSLIPFTAGRVKKFLNGNCASIGLSSAFLEPLQATSIHCAMVQLEYLTYNFFADVKLFDDPVLIKKYNNQVSELYDEMRDFVALHYTCDKKNSEFWKFASTLERPERMKELLYLAQTRLLRTFDFAGSVGSVGQESWNPILSGLGHFNNDVIEKVLKSEAASVSYWNKEVEEFEKFVIEKYKNNLSANELNAVFLSI